MSETHKVIIVVAIWLAVGLCGYGKAEALGFVSIMALMATYFIMGKP
jgi:hypothetical protein